MSATIKILFFGDIVGQSGRRVVRELLLSAHRPAADIVIANIENASDEGFGFREEDIRELQDLGIHGFTGGNHSFHLRTTNDFIDQYPMVLRPANYPCESAGRAWCMVTAGSTTIAVINLLGHQHMQSSESPLLVVDDLLEQAGRETNLILVDLHATSTGEKAALAYYLDGRTSIVCGTHTHVQTADERILPGGTAFITDVGACATMHSIIGMDFDAVYKRLLGDRQASMKAASGRSCASAILVEVDKTTGKALHIERISYSEIEASDNGALSREALPTVYRLAASRQCEQGG
jgi:2',3'-cyclic-nucleotide 2'-phosphodiesterase